jgi:hypothetical protein
VKKKVFLIGLILVILAGTVLIKKYYFHKEGKVFGDIYVTMKSGDIKRVAVAGVDVVIYKVDDPNAVLQQIDSIQKQYMKPLTESVREYGETVNEMQEKSDEYAKFRDSCSEKAYEQSISKSAEKKLRIKQLKAEHNSKINGILTPFIFKKGKSDVKGHYEFTDAPYGKYIVFSNYSILEENGDWLYPIEVNNKENRIDLTNNNMYQGDIFF